MGGLQPVRGITGTELSRLDNDCAEERDYSQKENRAAGECTQGGSHPRRCYRTQRAGSNTAGCNSRHSALSARETPARQPPEPGSLEPPFLAFWGGRRRRYSSSYQSGLPRLSRKVKVWLPRSIWRARMAFSSSPTLALTPVITSSSPLAKLNPYSFKNLLKAR